MGSSEDIAFLSDRYKTPFEFFEWNKIKFGQMNKWIEPYGFNFQLIIRKKKQPASVLNLDNFPI